MLRRSILAFIALALYFNAPDAHAAGGINLSWDDCGAFGSAQKTFACDTNAGSETLVLSAIPNAPMQLNGQATVIDLETNQSTLSNWWHLEVGGCRSISVQAISVGFDFTSGPLHCVDVWNGLASGGINYLASGLGPNRARFRAVCALAATTSVDATSEFYIERINISHAKTVGACSGCADGVCLVFQQVLLTQPAGLGDQWIYNPILRQYVTWQSGAAGFTDVFGIGCPQATPARNASWGSIKSLYR